MGFEKGQPVAEVPNFAIQNSPIMTATDWIGFAGVSILLLAYFMNLRSIISKESVSYLLLNVLGAALASLASVMLQYWPFIILEGCWTLVSLAGLIGYLQNPSQKSGASKVN